jgi:hypothetical protein
MSTNCPRVAFFTDNFHEVNGTALTSRHLIAFARKNDFPFLAVYCTDDAAHTEDEHPLALPMRRGRLTISVERDFVFDILFWRYAAKVRERSWDRVFEDVFKVYKLAASEPRHGMRGILPQRSHLVSWLAY